MSKSVMALYLNDDEYDKSVQFLREDGGYLFYGYNSDFGIAKKAVFRKDGKLEWGITVVSGMTSDNYVSKLDEL